MKHEIDETVEVSISDIAYEGKGVGKIDGYVYFIPKTAVGDTVRAKITKSLKNFSEAKTLEVLFPSKERVTPDCSYFNNCGGCHYMHLDYQSQLKIKKNQLIRTLQKIGRIENPTVSDTIPSKLDFRYRNKAILHVDDNGNLGYVTEENQDIIDIDYCLVCEEKINRIISKIHKFIKTEKSNLGIKNILIRNTKHPEGITLIFALPDIEDSSFNILVKSLKKSEEKISIFKTQSPQDSSMVFSKKIEHVAGEKTIKEKLADFNFELSPLSFFQINRWQAEKLVETVIDVLGNEIEGKEILDLYCGAGLFSLPLSKNAKAIVGIDSSESSLNDAIKSAELNSIKNAEFIRGRARETTKELLRNNKKFEIVVMDPTRQGADEKLLKNIIKLGAKKIIYISCSPPTLARDIKFLSKNGFKLKKVVPIDMFPHTYHIESVSLIDRE